MGSMSDNGCSQQLWEPVARWRKLWLMACTAWRTTLLWSSLILLAAISTPVAATDCPHSDQRKVTIGGNRIHGVVERLNNRPAKFQEVDLYSSSGKIAWQGKTDAEGMFGTGQMPPDDYRIVVSGWGNAYVTLQSGLDSDAYWHLVLHGTSCIFYIMIKN